MKETLRERAMNLEHATKDALAHLRDELDEHLDGINSNTIEVQQLQDILCEFDARMKKVEDKVDMLCHKLIGEEEKISFAKLTIIEQEVLYTLTKHQTIRVALLSHKIGITIRNLENSLHEMKKKGIPLQFEEKQEQLCVTLANYFREQLRTSDSIKFASRVARQFS